MKLSEFLKDKGIELPDDLVDDTTGVSFRDMRGRYSAYGDLEKEHANVKQQYGQKEEELNGALQQVHQLQNHIRQVTTPPPGASQGQIDRAWRAEALYSPLVPYLDHLENVITVSAQALAGMHQQYQADRSSMSQYLYKREVDRMKSNYPDFDENKVKEVAKKHNLDDWDGAYRLWRTESEPDRIKKAQDETRAATLKELEGRTAAPPITEMGTTNPAPAIGGGPTGPGGEQKEYGKAWSGLAEEIKGLGF